jgi:hypothetical protein
MKKLLPVLLLLAGLGGGAGAGLMLKPASPDACAPAEGEAHAAGEAMAGADGHSEEDGQTAAAASTAAECPPPEDAHEEADPAEKPDFVALNKQFVIPVLDGARVKALVVASLAVEVDPGLTDTVFALEPKLRDAFLQVMFVHSHSGGFDGEFTSGRVMADLRARLVEAAKEVLGGVLRDVLITEIVRQDM